MTTGVLHRTTDGRVVFWCPGCAEPHAVPVSGPNAWTFSGTDERPTLAPSVLIRSGHYIPGHKQPECWCTYNAAHPEAPAPFQCRVCHSFVRDGQIQYLADCTHPLAGRTVPLEAW